MICPLCGKSYAAQEAICERCAVPLQADGEGECGHGGGAAAAGEAPMPARPPGVDRTLAKIKQDIDIIDGPGADDRPQAAAVSDPVHDTPASACRPAGFFIRLIASFIDNFILSLIAVVLAVAGYVVLEQNGVIIHKDPEQLVRWLWGLYLLPCAVISAFYFIYFHAVTGQTFGKWVCGIQVVTAAGVTRIGWARAAVRFTGYCLVSMLLYVGFLWIMVDRKKRGWHDFLAGSMVVYGTGRQGA